MAIALIGEATSANEARVAALEATGQPVVHIAPREPASLVAMTVAALAQFRRTPAAFLRALVRPSTAVRAAQIAARLQRSGIRTIETDGSGDARSMAAVVERFLHSSVTAPEDIASVDWRSLNLTPIGLRWLSTRVDSVIADVVVTDGTRQRDVIFKQHTLHADPRRSPAVRARHEFDVLSRLHRVPRPLLLDLSRGALVMERASGIPLDELIRTAKRRTDVVAALEQPVRLAGFWLRSMQAETRTDEDPEALLEQILEPVTRSVPRGVAQRVRTLAARTAAGSMSIAGHHGDYWPGNIFIDGEGVEVIDFEGFRSGFPLEDVAYFLLELELLFPRSRSAVPELRRIFLDSWSGGRAVDETALDLFTVTKGLHLLARNPGAGQPFPIRAFIRRALRSNVERCLR